MNRIKIILADDHSIVRQGVRALLDQEIDMTVIGEASDGIRLLELTEKLRPNVVIVDIKMPNLNGLEAAEHIRKHFPETHIVILTMLADPAYINRALEFGADGYVLKNEDIRETFAAIRHAAHGDNYLSAEITSRFPDIADRRTRPADPIKLLTPRERQVFQIIAEGKSNQEAAEILGISIRTVEVHRSHIMSKLNLKTHVDLVRFALKYDILANE